LKDSYKAKWQLWFNNNENRHLTRGGNRRRASHAEVVGWLNEMYHEFDTKRDMITRSFVCCGLLHSHLPFVNASKFAARLNGRLKDILFVVGHNFDRDSLLCNLIAFQFGSHTELMDTIQRYLVYKNVAQVTSSVSVEPAIHGIVTGDVIMPVYSAPNPVPVARGLSFNFSIDAMLSV
jgi:hypothetical protein